MFQLIHSSSLKPDFWISLIYVPLQKFLEVKKYLIIVLVTKLVSSNCSRVLKLQSHSSCVAIFSRPYRSRALVSPKDVLKF